MTVFNVSSAQQLTAALSQAHGGDSILLAAGNYGDVSLASLRFSSNVTIQSASSTNPAVFNSFHVTSSQNITVSGVDVHMQPTATSTLWDSAVAIYNSTGIAFTHSTITGAPAVNGVPQTATALDATGNVIGLPTGQGVTVIGSTGVSLTGNTITDFDRGVNLSNTSSIAIIGNHISDLRQTGIGGGNLSNVTISGNTISDSNPWAWGQAYGDHADFIHIWTSPPAQTSASSNINISDNLISQGAGAPILGINLEAQTATGQTTPVGFSGVTISDNAVILGNAQGMRLENLANSSVSNNTLVQPETGGVSTPGILFAQGGATNTVVSGNVAGSITSQANSSTNTFTNNYVAQDQNQSAANYFSPKLATQAASMSDPAAIHALIQGALPQTTTASVYQNTAANIVANLPALNVSSTLSKIVITDNAPVTLTFAQWLSNGQVLNELVNQDGSHVKYVIKDTAVTIAAALGTLNGQASINSIVLSDNQPLWLKAAQVAQDGEALAKLINANGSAVLANVSDTAANIGSALDALMASNAKLGSISVTDKGVITLGAREFVSDQSLLAKVHSAGGYSIHDTAANVDQQLDQLSAMQKASGLHFSSLMVTDGRPVQVSYAELIADSNVIKMLTNPDGTPAKVTVVDTGATILANLNALNWTANIGSIVVSDGASLTLTSLLKSQDAIAVSKLVYADGSAVRLLTGATSSASLPASLPALSQPQAPTAYSAGAADISAKLDTLNSSGQSIVITDNQALSLTVNQALNDGQALSHLTNANGTAVVVNVRDAAANIAAHLDALGSVHGLGSIRASDGHTLNLSAGQLTANAAVVAHLAANSITVTDTAAHIVDALASMTAEAAVGAVSVSDNTMVRVDASIFDANAAGLAKIGGRHIVDEINIKGQAYTSEFFTFGDSGAQVSHTFVAADGTRTVYADAGNVVFSDQPVAQTIHAIGSGNTFDFRPGFGSETIYGFAAGDHLSFDHLLFSSAGAALATASDNGLGDVVFDVAPGETITIAGMTMHQLASMSSVFHFF